MLTPDAMAGVRAVALDVDGTIAGSDHRLGSRTVEAIRAVQAAGLPVVLLTGRTRANTLELARECGVQNWVAACNGAVVLDPGLAVDTRVRTMAPRDVEAIVGLHLELGMELTWWTSDAVFVERDGECRRALIELDESDVRVAPLAEASHLPVVKMMLCADSERLDAAAGRIEQAAPRGTRSMHCFYEFVDADANKWAALSHIAAHLEIPPEHFLGAGDAGNDVVWLSRIGVPVAMANARPEVKAVAAHEIGHHRDEAVADMLELLLELDR